MFQTRDHFPALLQKVRREFPSLSDEAVRHAANNITNKIRQGKCDCWNIEVSRGPMDDNGQYIHFNVEASGVVVYVRVTTD